ENARLLLNLPPRLLRRVNEFDNAGRFLTQHPRGPIATIKASPRVAYKLQRLYNNFHRPRGSRAREPQYECGFALTESAQREHQLLNASAAIYYDVDETSPWKAGKRLRTALHGGKFGREALRDVGHVVTGTATVMPNLVRRYLLGREVVHVQPNICVVADFEQEPNPESRITLLADIDALGIRMAAADWRVSDAEKRTARHFCGFIAAEFDRLGLGQGLQADWLAVPARNNP